jgi:molecular chaperone DnaK (HSP70)
MTDENAATAGCGDPDPNRSVFGIDLGTTFSAIAVHTPAGPVVVDLFNSGFYWVLL